MAGNAAGGNRGGPGKRDARGGGELARTGQPAAGVRVAVLPERGNRVPRIVRNINLAGDAVGNVQAAKRIHVKMGAAAGALVGQIGAGNDTAGCSCRERPERMPEKHLMSPEVPRNAGHGPDRVLVELHHAAAVPESRVHADEARRKNGARGCIRIDQAWYK